MSQINRVIRGEAADPSILRDGDTFYLTHSSYSFNKGLLILESKDLVNWTPVCRALDSFLSDVWAPDLIKSNNKYYIYFPAMGSNFVIYADDIRGPWSDPIDLKVNYIDPGHIEDVKTKERFLHFSNGYACRINKEGTKIIEPLEKVYNGYEYPKEWEVEGFCLESPKLIYKDPYYYLTVAQGGSAGPATSHMVVSARSKSPLGPFENSPYNPIVHTYSSKEQWHSKGHGTIFNDTNDNWWIIYHAYEKGQHNHGRQTLIEGIKWTDDGWFVLDNKDRILKEAKEIDLSQSFKGIEPSIYFASYKEKISKKIESTQEGLILKPSKYPITIVPYDYDYMVETKARIEDGSWPDLSLFYSESFSANIYYDGKDIVTTRGPLTYKEDFKTDSEYIYFRLRKRDNIISFFYSIDKKEWIKTHVSHEVSSYNHNVLGNFLSLRVGLINLGQKDCLFEYFNYLRS